MKNIVLSSFILILFMSAISSCKEKCEAGSGGALTVVAFAKHHGAETKPFWAYVKYNTQDFPGASASAYDEVIAADTTEDHIELENLQCGDYYIYMIAIDPAINDTVYGGVPFSTEQKMGEVNVNVAVVE